MAGDTLYTGADDGYLYALNVHTGTLRWRSYGPPTLGDNTSIPSGMPALGNGVLYVPVNDALLAVSMRDGGTLWRYTVKDKGVSSPVLAGSIVYFGALDGRAYAVNT